MSDCKCSQVFENFMRKEQEKQDIWLWSELILIQIAHQPTNLQKTTNFPAVLYKIDRKVQKLAFKFVGLILLSDCKWQLDAPKQNAAVRPWLLPTIKGTQEKWIILGVCIVVWGVWWGPPWSQSVDMGSLVQNGDGVVVGWFNFGF